MQTNHLSHFLLTLGLLPALRKAAEQQQQQQQQGGFVPRIVTVASAMHHLGYRLQQDPLSQQSYSAELAYGNSKLAQVGRGNACAPAVNLVHSCSCQLRLQHLSIATGRR
jgi:NAD(P)-dependent dehydrogenase (short-subunit alcohol dehydrogenase family)